MSDDTIYRQAAIDALDEIRHALWEIDIPSPTVPEYVEHHEQVQSVWKLLDKKQKELYVLPSAQTEPCDDPMADVYYLAEKIGIHQLYALVVALRGEPDPCENAVSRRRLLNDLKELIAAWKKYPVMAEQIKGVETAIKYVELIPPVTPKRKTGKWVNNIHDLPVCDQCGYMTPYDRAIDDYEYGNFCPNCGADMRGGEAT